MPRGRKASLVVAVFVAVIAAVPTLARADSLPFSDPSASGSIGLCDRDNRPVTGGKTADRPFVVKAVGSQRPPDPFAVAGGKATLYAFQPRQDAPPDQWTSVRLTASSTYSNPAHPSAQATQLDRSLDKVMELVPPGQASLFQLRLLYSAPGVGVAPSPYATTVIKVQNGSWSVVQGASVSCTDGSARSSEVDAGLVNAEGSPIGTAAAAASSTAAAVSPATTGSPDGATSSPLGAPSVSASATPSDSATAGLAVAASDSGGGYGGVALSVVIPVIAVLLGAGWWWWWRRRGPAVPET